MNGFDINLVTAADERNQENGLEFERYGFEGIGFYLRQIGRVALLDAQDEVELAKRIEAGLFSDYHLRKLKEAGVALPSFIRRDLTWVARDGRRARPHLIEANLRLVVSLAKRYQHRGLDLLDLVQHGNLGLLRAVEKFDYKNGHRFSTYAAWWIRQAIVRGVFNEARLIRVPVTIEEAVARIERAESTLDREAQGKATVDIVAAEVDMSEDDIRELKNAARTVSSLERLVYDTDSRYADLADKDEVAVIDLVSHSLLCDQLESVLETLSAREAAIIRLRNGIGLGRRLERDEVAEMHGVTTERIRQIETQALKKLRHPSRSQVLRDYV